MPNERLSQGGCPQHGPYGCPPDCARGQELQTIKWLEANKEKIPPAVFKILSEKLGLTDEEPEEKPLDTPTENNEPQEEEKNPFVTKVGELLKKFPRDEAIERWQDRIQKLETAGEDLSVGKLLDMIGSLLRVLDPQKSGEFIDESLFRELNQLLEEKFGREIIYPKQGDAYSQKNMELTYIQRGTKLPADRVFQIVSFGYKKGDSTERKAQVIVSGY